MKTSPDSFPRLTGYLLDRILPRQDEHSLRAGLQELFCEVCDTKGRRTALMWLWLEILKSIPGFFYSCFYWRMMMFKNYLLMTLRNIRKYKSHSLINIAGLSLGMAVCLLIYLWVQDEVRYDRFHQQKDHIAQVFTEMTSDRDQHQIFMGSYYPLARILKAECPEVAAAARFATSSGIAVKKDEHIFFNDTIGFADTEFLKIFSFPLTTGAKKTVLSDKSSIVLTAKMARKYFGIDDPVGQIITLNNNQELKVTGVLRDLPARSSLKFDCLIPFAWFYGGGQEPEHWGGNPLATWVLLQPQSGLEQTAGRITSIVDRHEATKGYKREFRLFPLSRTHLYSPYGGGLNRTLTIFSLIAFLVLLIACINYINLSTARAAVRAKEIGVRKVMGAKKDDLVRQFIGESMLITFFTLLISIGLLYMALPVFNELVDKQLSLSLLLEKEVILGFLGIALFTGLLAGIYPAFYLASMLPSDIFRRRIFSALKGAYLRKALVIMQFSSSIILIICTTVIVKQINYIQTKDLGFDQDNLATLQINRELQQQYEVLRTKLLKNTNILAVSRSLQHPVNISSTVGALDWIGKNPEDGINFNWDYVNYDYAATLGLELVKGREFSREFPSDLEGAFIINEKAAEIIGRSDPVGERLSVFREEGQIIGVVKNFHFQPLYYEIRPFVFILKPNTGSNVFIRIRTGSEMNILAHVKSVCSELSADFPVSLGFFNEIMMDYIYTSEKRMQKAAVYFAVLAVLISCLGLLGLTVFIAERKAKELSLRKVLGASVSSLVFLLSGNMAKWVLYANLIAWPVAYFVVRQLLSRYAFHTGLGLDVFLLSGALALLVALFTVGGQSLRAALAEPAETLRYE